MAHRPTRYEQGMRNRGIGMRIDPYTGKPGGWVAATRGIGLSIDPWTMRPIEDVVPYRPENWVPGIG